MRWPEFFENQQISCGIDRRVSVGAPYRSGSSWLATRPRKRLKETLRFNASSLIKSRYRSHPCPTAPNRNINFTGALVTVLFAQPLIVAPTHQKIRYIFYLSGKRRGKYRSACRLSSDARHDFYSAQIIACLFIEEINP
jgi:hypothetical protein